MRAGEYIGAYGLVHSWGKSLGGCYALYDEHRNKLDIITADLRAAAAALVALADERETEYVELMADLRVVLRHGKRPVPERYVAGGWSPLSGNLEESVLAAFRAGQERGKA